MTSPAAPIVSVVRESFEVNFRIECDYNDDGYSPYVHLSDGALQESLENMLDAQDVVIDQPSIGVVFTYPLSKPLIATLHPPNGASHFTRASLAQAIGEKYQAIYAEEEAASTLPVETMAERSHRLNPDSACMLVNRADTDGPYGIWGHALTDLCLHSVRFVQERNLFVLGIDS